MDSNLVVVHVVTVEIEDSGAAAVGAVVGLVVEVEGLEDIHREDLQTVGMVVDQDMVKAPQQFEVVVAHSQREHYPVGRSCYVGVLRSRRTP